jgi:hypothetical protein
MVEKQIGEDSGVVTVSPYRYGPLGKGFFKRIVPVPK